MLILASQSPRRRQILQDAGIEFVARAPQVQEFRHKNEGAVEYVRRLAEEKASAVELAPGEIALGADTVVVLDDHILEKPRDQVDARRMLDLLSGREHAVVTGVCLRSANRTVVESVSTKVRFVMLTPEEISAYVASGEPLDKAGAYAIQGLASKFIDRVEGCYFNVVGLPVALVYKYLKEFPP